MSPNEKPAPVIPIKQVKARRYAGPRDSQRPPEAHANEEATLVDEQLDEPTQHPWPDLVEVHRGRRTVRDWFAKGIIEGQPLGLLIGPEKSHKSWALMDLAVATIVGQKWLGTFQCLRPGKVAFADFEYGPHEFTRRIDRICRGRDVDTETALRQIQYVPDRRLTLCGDLLRASPKALNERQRDQRQPLVDLFHKLRTDPPALVILDPLRNVLNGSENDADVATSAFLALDALRNAANAPVICAHHVNKSGGYSGSRALLTRADLIIEGSDENDVWYGVRSRTLRRDDRAASRFTVRVTHDDDNDDAIAATRLSAQFQGEGRGAVTANAQRVLSALEDGPMTPNAIKTAIGRSGTAVQTALVELESKMLIKRCANGKTYELAGDPLDVFGAHA